MAEKVLLGVTTVVRGGVEVRPLPPPQTLVLTGEIMSLKTTNWCNRYVTQWRQLPNSHLPLLDIFVFRFVVLSGIPRSLHPSALDVCLIVSRDLTQSRATRNMKLVEDELPQLVSTPRA